MKVMKGTLAVNVETLCELSVTKTIDLEIGDKITLSNKLDYKVIAIELDRVLVEYF